jgi:hypothetical protein
VTKTFKDWMSEGESIYNAALADYQAIQSQLEQLEAKLAEKKTDVNQIAQMIGRAGVDNSKRVSAQLVEHAPPPGTIGSVTRALTGRTMVARPGL